MPRYVEQTVAQSTADAMFNSGGINNLIQANNGDLYLVYIDSGSDVAFKKSTDNGLTWSNSTIVFAGTAVALSVWFDRWSNIAAGLIHCVYTESATDDTLYRTINTESSDALSTQTVIFAGASTATTGFLSVTRAVGGNVYCRTCIDAGTEGGFYRLPNANVPNGAWDAARTINEANAANDAIILLPDYDAADTQDIMAVFWDTSASEISRLLHDDSANSWSETSIATSMTKVSSATSFRAFDVAYDIANTCHYLAAWSARDTANADLRFWTIDSGSITEGTNVVLNSTDDQDLAAISYDAATGIITVFYAGASGGSETVQTALSVYCKQSTDGGTTWGPETKVIAGTRTYNIPAIWTSSRHTGKNRMPPVAFLNNATLEEIMVVKDIVQPRASYQLLG
jgi:hypothetical protein